MSDERVALESIVSCLQGVVPSPFATCSAGGVPNVTYMSIVQYVDAERVALSRQFFNKTAANLEENPVGQVVVVDPETIEQYALDLRYLHTETDGPVFEAMKANLEAIASQSGVGSHVFRLRGVDIHRVDRCVRIGADPDPEPARGREPQRDVLKALDDFVRRVGAAADYGDATRIALEGLEDLFGFPHAILLSAGEPGDRLFAVAANGYPTWSAGAEVRVGEGVIGVAAERCQVVSVSNLARSRVMGTAVQDSLQRRGGRQGSGPEIPLPGLESVQSVAAVPLLVHGALVGILYLESDHAGRFGAHNERLLRVLGGHLAAVLAAFDRDRAEGAEAIAPAAPASEAAPREALEITYYQADDSVFAGDDYVIKGVAGRILFKLLREHEADGRTEFTNRQLRLDEQLGLPAGNDNLESRLVMLRRRLEAGRWGVELERVARGRLALHVRRPVSLVEVPTQGPMKTAFSDPDPAA